MGRPSRDSDVRFGCFGMKRQRRSDLRRRIGLRRAARDRLGAACTGGSVLDWIGPGRHRARRSRAARGSGPALRHRRAGNCARRPHCLVVIGERSVVAQRRNAERVIDAARARPVDGRDAHPLRRFLEGAGIQTGGFRLVPPRFPLGEHIVAAAGENDQSDEDEGADEIPTNSARHARTMRRILLRTAQ